MKGNPDRVTYTFSCFYSAEAFGPGKLGEPRLLLFLVDREVRRKWAVLRTLSDRRRMPDSPVLPLKGVLSYYFFHVIDGVCIGIRDTYGRKRERLCKAILHGYLCVYEGIEREHLHG